MLTVHHSCIRELTQSAVMCNRMQQIVPRTKCFSVQLVGGDVLQLALPVLEKQSEI